MHQYLTRLYTIIYTRGDIEVETLNFEQPSTLEGRIEGRLRFPNGSILVFEEKALGRGKDIEKTEYRYHYQSADGRMLFRYDNAPHHPEIATYPHHVHVGDWVETAEPPDLTDVLRRIDHFLYGHL